MSILVDDRAGSQRLMQYPPFTTEATLTRLDAGDVAFVGNGPDGPLMVGVEIKSISDLISSINTGRLQATQLPGLLSSYDVRWLVYYGVARAGRNGSFEVQKGTGWREYHLGSRTVPFGYVESMLFDVTAVGVSVRHVRDEAEAAVWIGCLYRWWSKQWDKHHGLHAFDRSRGVSLLPGMDNDTHFRAKVAKELPGVGYERAVAAARHFSSVTDMINASVDEWSRVPGIGKVLARAIVEALR